MKTFNFSPSALGIWIDSPLWGYYKYCSDYEEDTETLSCYWKSGNATHETLEYYHKFRDRDKAIKYFDKLWEEKGLFEELDFKGRPLSKEQYLDATIYDMKLIDEEYDVIESELKIELSFREGYMKKGFLDILAIHNGKLTIMDFKTSSSIDTSPKFRNQVLFYAHLYYAKTGRIINHARIEYLKKKEAKPYEFTDDEVINFEENVLVPIYDMIQRNGDNEFAYELGKWDSPFNDFLLRCRQMEEARRPNKIVAIRKDNKLYFENGIPSTLHKIFDKYFSYKSEYWENKFGRKVRKEYPVKFLKRNTLPFGFIHEIKRVISKYNERTKNNFELFVIDKRDQNVVNAKYQTKFKDSDYEIRDYQEEAILKALSDKIGILNLSVSAGKTLISSELIKRTNVRCLMLVNRQELLNQTADFFEEELQIPIGRMVEGDLEIDKQVTIASVQTIVSILKRNDESSDKLRMYLYNVGMVQYDEAHNCSNNKTYGIIADELVNVEYCISLTGTAFRNDGATLEMNAMCGFPIYKKTSVELEAEGYICPININFIQVEARDDTKFDDYHKTYMYHIVEHQKRNKKIIDLVNEHRKNEKILVLVSRLAHGEYLSENIDNSFFIHGEVDKKLRKDKMKEFKEKEGMVLVGMTSILSEGISIDSLSMLILAGSGASETKVVQQVGRLRRLDKNDKNKVGKYFDFIDRYPTFYAMSRKRIRRLKMEGYEIDT